MGSINDMFKEVNTKFKGVLALKEIVNDKGDQLDPDDKTKEFLEKFEEEIRSAVKKAEDRLQQIEEEYKALAAYFVESPRDFTIEVLFDIFSKFSKHLKVR